jgi:hypothetical protein
MLTTNERCRVLISKHLGQVIETLNQEYRKLNVHIQIGDYGDSEREAQFARSALSKAAECVYAAKDALDEFESNR